MCWWDIVPHKLVFACLSNVQQRTGLVFAHGYSSHVKLMVDNCWNENSRR